MRSIITENAKETQKVAADLAKKLLKKKLNETLVVALEGELGAGKTTFIKGFSRTLGVRERILSPTFVLIHRHKIRNSQSTMKQYKNLFHIDAYRLNSGKDLLKLGIKEIFANPKNIVLIEWADRVKKVIPKTSTWIQFDHSDKNRRRIKINSL